ncbi:MAG: hypothetical protein E6300_07590 [Clostridium sp.]|uniref:hypothetical protein n=1 Tax=Clostridium sp. TaxID=1506 RepID=UPI001ED724D7|nr:hypothetical protein [Clostridium sp.]MBS5886305.1 hypothetical protein [Clostridium sp.]MDU7148336.1 hypothetical protein [Clostridium sp.]MDU7243277.1 hypothetical protein [Clostridium sp.]
MSKIKITNFEMLNGLNTLGTLARYKLPVKISYGIKKNIEIISREIKIYEEERAVLIDKYGEKDKDGKVKIENNNFLIKDVENFNKDIRELQSIENEIETYDISLDLLLNSNIELTTAELTSIEFLLK